MTLLAKTTLFYLLVALLVFGVGGVVTYKMVKKEVEKETDYYLWGTYRQLVDAIRDGKPPRAFNNDKVQICELEDRAWTDTLAIFSDTLGNHFTLDRLEPHRKLTKIKNIDGTWYQFSLIDALIEPDDMYEGVIDILSQLFLFLSVTLIAFSFFFARLLLRPFKEMLKRIGQFNLKNQDTIQLPRSTTKEFKELRSFVENMTGKARRDYLSLKEFNENASHEMQTPIAVAKGKLELLLQDEQLSDRQAALIQAAHQSISKLSRIGSSLSLLNKIENREFAVVDKIDLAEVVRNCITHFDELAQLKGLEIEHEIKGPVSLPIDTNLADILLSNLLKNAIQHNELGGWIKVELNDKRLLFRNSGKPPKLSTRKLFGRFSKGDYHGGSVGLGLSIVKKICDVSRWQVQYEFQEGVHELSILFSKVEQPVPV